jgi:hypothetical protein
MEPDGEEAAAFVQVLADVVDLRRRLDQLELHVIDLVRASGATWEEIGDELGISRQAARDRYGKLRRRRAPS